MAPVDIALLKKEMADADTAKKEAATNARVCVKAAEEQMEMLAGLTNSVNFTEIRRIPSPLNFKIGEFTVHRFEIFEKIKKL
jgi:hypothetical protein